MQTKDHASPTYFIDSCDCLNIATESNDFSLCNSKIEALLFFMLN